MITGLIAFRIWHTDRAVAPFRPDPKGKLIPIVKILIESVSLQLAAEVILFILYAIKNNGQYIVLETICSLVVSPSPNFALWVNANVRDFQGITYTALTIRVTLQLQLRESFSEGPGLSSLDFSPSTRSTGRPRSDLSNVMLPPMSNFNLETGYATDLESCQSGNAHTHHTGPCSVIHRRRDRCIATEGGCQSVGLESANHCGCCSEQTMFTDEQSPEKML